MPASDQACVARSSLRRFTRRVLKSFTTTPRTDPAAARLLAVLSAREVEVLRLLGTDLDGPEIARTLVVSMNTLRTHTKNIYAKRGVNTRRAAVSRAQQLGLLTPVDGR